MNPELERLLKVRTPLVSYVTWEDDRLLRHLASYSKTSKKLEVKVYNSTFGLKALDSYLSEWDSIAGPGAGPHDIQGALNQVYLDRPHGHTIYVFLDGSYYLSDPNVARRVQNILEQGRQNASVSKTLILTGTKRPSSERFTRSIYTVVDPGPTPEEVTREVPKKLFPNISGEEVSLLSGLTLDEVSHLLQASYLKTKDPGPPRVDPHLVATFKRSRMSSSILQVTSPELSFADLGGSESFKTWVRETACSWTQEGQEYGLRPPKGVLLLGVYGCGKTLAVKTMAHEWGLPLVTLDLSRVRSSGVGDSESHLHSTMASIEALAPCVVHLDEAEKALSGKESSAGSDSGVTARLIGMFSTWLQETEAKVCLALTANTLKGLPTEIVNRMSERFFFDLPNQTTREEILRIHVESRRHTLPSYSHLAECADRLVGREIEQAVEAALVASYRLKLPSLGETQLQEELEFRPRLSDTLEEEIRTLSSWCNGVGRGPRARRA